MRRTALVTLFLLLIPATALATADLHLNAEHAETRLPSRAVFGLRMYVSNFGPGMASDVRLTITGLDEIEGVGLPAGCLESEGSISCSLGDLSAGPAGQRSLRVRLQGPPRSRRISILATLSSVTDDPDIANNAFTRNYEFVESVDLAGEIQILSRRVDPGAVAQAVTSVRNQVDSNPSDVRVHYSLDRGTIEAIDAPSRWKCSIDGANAECVASSLDPFCRCSGEMTLEIRTPSDSSGGVTTLWMAATSSLPDFFRQMRRSAAISAYRWIEVTTSSAAGPGSLRDAIWQTNDECGDDPCKIAFAIPASELVDGVAVISPSEPLPVIMATNVFLDGTTQAIHAGDTNPAGPEIVIDGALLRQGRGIELHSSCDAIIAGLAIVNFPNEAIVYDNRERCTTLRTRQIRDNYIGVDPTGTRAMPNRRGVYASGDYADVFNNVISGNIRAGIWANSFFFRAHENRIGTAADGITPIPNGASGIYVTPRNRSAEVLHNLISWNREMGVAVARSAGYVDIRENSMRGNGGLGIDVGLDGHDGSDVDETLQSKPPVLLSATYDDASRTTTVRGFLHTEKLGPYGNAVQIDLYANDSPDGDGEEWVQHVWQAPVLPDGTPFTLIVSADLRGRWVNATSTRIHFIASTPGVQPASSSSAPNAIAGGDAKTSELSQAVRVTQN